MNFLEFNNKKVHFVKRKGVYCIIVKSVCEALSIDFERQRRTINEDPILGSAPSIQTVQIQRIKEKCRGKIRYFGSSVSFSPRLESYSQFC